MGRHHPRSRQTIQGCRLLQRRRQFIRQHRSPPSRHRPTRLGCHHRPPLRRLPTSWLSPPRAIPQTSTTPRLAKEALKQFPRQRHHQAQLAVALAAQTNDPKLLQPRPRRRAIQARIRPLLPRPPLPPPQRLRPPRLLHHPRQNLRQITPCIPPPPICRNDHPTTYDIVPAPASHRLAWPPKKTFIHPLNFADNTFMISPVQQKLIDAQLAPRGHRLPNQYLRFAAQIPRRPKTRRRSRPPTPRQQAAPKLPTPNLSRPHRPHRLKLQIPPPQKTKKNTHPSPLSPHPPPPPFLRSSASP